MSLLQHLSAYQLCYTATKLQHTGTSVSNYFVAQICHSISYLINLFVVQILSVRDVLFANSVVHISLDASRCDRINCDLLVPAICQAISLLTSNHVQSRLTDSHASDECLDRAFAPRVYRMFWHTLRLTSDASLVDVSNMRM